MTPDLYQIWWDPDLWLGIDTVLGDQPRIRIRNSAHTILDLHPDKARELANHLTKAAHLALTLSDAPSIWVNQPPPGGYLCAECHTPTETEPCPDHQPHAYKKAHPSWTE